MNSIRQAARYTISMLEEKSDGLRRLSMTRCAVAAFTVVYCARLWWLDGLGWPDAWLAFVVLFALPLSKAFSSADPDKVVEAVMGSFGRSEGQERWGGPSRGYSRPQDLVTDDHPSFHERDEPT